MRKAMDKNELITNWKINLVKLLHKLNAYLNAVGVGQFPFLRSLKHHGKWLMMKTLMPDGLCSIKVDGLTLYVYANTASFQDYVLKAYEPYTTELFKQVVKPGATVLDIGAQFGYYSLIAAKQIRQGGKVYAFEPVPNNFELLKRNIQINRCNQMIHAVQKAVGDKPTTVRIFVYRDSDSHGMYCHPKATVKETITVESIAMDEFLGGQPVDVIKMDIEGNEPFALEGMKQTIAKSPSIILFTELNPAFLRRAGVKSEDYLTQLEDLGFDIQLIDESAHCLRTFAAKDLRAKVENNPSWYTNLYCRKGGSLGKK